MSPGNLRRTEGLASKWANLLAGIGATLALVTAASAITSMLTVETPDTAVANNTQIVARLVEAHAEMKGEVAAVQRQLAALKPPLAGRAPSTSEVEALRRLVSELAVRQKRIEDAISRDPARALELPLLRRDLDNIKESQAQAADTMKQSVSQIYDLNKWLIGGGALSLLAIAVSMLLARWKGSASN